MRPAAGIPLILLTVVVCLLAACSSPSGATDAAAATSRAAPAGGSAGASGGEGASPTVDDAVRDAWAATAATHRGMAGEQFTYACPGGGEPRNVWGTETYTDDSSVCTAAVHAGAITLEQGGRVIIEIAPGGDEYEASERNGIESLPYGAWGGSFVVVGE